MTTLLEEIDELLSRAKYMEENHPNTPITPDHWSRLNAACERARRFSPRHLEERGVGRITENLGRSVALSRSSERSAQSAGPVLRFHQC